MELLIVDDDPDDMVLYEDAIKSITPGICITPSPNGREALRLLTTTDYVPDLVLLDYNLPRMTGLELLTTLRAYEKWEFLNVVVVSAACSPSKRESFRMLGTLCYNKPHTFEGLRQLLVSILNLFGRDKLNV